jgi:broad specificity phosphatase PhoE
VTSPDWSAGPRGAMITVEEGTDESQTLPTFSSAPLVQSPPSSLSGSAVGRPVLAYLVSYGEGMHKLRVSGQARLDQDLQLLDDEHFDAPLSPQGRLQAEGLRVSLMSHPAPTLVVCSPLTRALETAQACFAGSHVLATDRVRESFGMFPATRRRPASELAEAFPGIDTSALPSGADPLWTATRKETLRSARLRLRAFLPELLGRACDEGAGRFGALVHPPLLLEESFSGIYTAASHLADHPTSPRSTNGPTGAEVIGVVSSASLLEVMLRELGLMRGGGRLREGRVIRVWFTPDAGAVDETIRSAMEAAALTSDERARVESLWKGVNRPRARDYEDDAADAPALEALLTSHGLPDPAVAWALARGPMTRREVFLLILSADPGAPLGPLAAARREQVGGASTRIVLICFKDTDTPWRWRVE